jgi:5-methylcytosine-specific restriction endonuclease McrA
MKKNCKKHGMVEYVFENRGYWRCKKCRSDAVTNARRRRKRKLVELAGGKCTKCGYDKCVSALQFHHINPSKKLFGIADSGITRTLQVQQKEIKKCILLCANCHAEEHDKNIPR